MSFFVYLLVSYDNKSTYVGATVNVDHRLRQHNGELSGGARATKIKLPYGKWSRVVYVSNFPTWTAALQFEWRWKQITRKTTTTTTKKHAVNRRMLALHTLINLPQSTSKAVPYSEWSEPPKLNFETLDSDAELFFQTLQNILV